MITKEEHFELMDKMAEEWHRENDKTKSERKAMRWIKTMKKLKGIS